MIVNWKNHKPGEEGLPWYRRRGVTAGRIKPGLRRWMRERKSIYAGEATNAGSINGGWRRRCALADTTGGWAGPCCCWAAATSERAGRQRRAATTTERERAVGAEKPSAQRSSFSLTHSVGYNTEFRKSCNNHVRADSLDGRGSSSPSARKEQASWRKLCGWLPKYYNSPNLETNNTRVFSSDAWITIKTKYAIGHS